MTTIAYYLMWENTDACLRLSSIENRFPCFVRIVDVDCDYFEAYIQCRTEDVNAIKALLADVV